MIIVKTRYSSSGELQVKAGNIQELRLVDLGGRLYKAQMTLVSGRTYDLADSFGVDIWETKAEALAVLEAVALEVASEAGNDVKDFIKEQNKEKDIKFWVGSQEEYDDILEPNEDTVYLIK